jgi:formylglycine-generating enzyme required for sulfatase activity
MKVPLFAVILFFSSLAQNINPQKVYRVSAVQDDQVWIEGGLLDGLVEGIEGEIFYEISIGGLKRRIIPARVRISKVSDKRSIGILSDRSGIVNIGYSAALISKPANDLLALFGARAGEAFAAKDYALSRQYYQNVLDVLPGDPFALKRIKECDAQLEKLAALARERSNVLYYKQAMRMALDSKNPENARLAQGYVEKILAIVPDDAEALRYKTQIEQQQKLESQAAEDSVKGTLLEKERPAPSIGIEKESLVPIEESKDKPASQPESVKSASNPQTLMNESRQLTFGPGERNKPSLPLENMILIPAGMAPIGTVPERTPFANEAPRHQIQYEAFYIDKYEVTNEDYKKFCDATNRIYPGYFIHQNIPEGTAKKPVVMVSWIDADAYARWAGKRLPTESEWEIAAAGASGRIWPWGDIWDSALSATRESDEDEPANVGSHPGDISAFGIYDMAGNVSEWTSSWYKSYPGNTRKEKEYGGQFRVLRGGSIKASKEFARCQFRARLPDGFRSMDLGFRCALSASAAGK